MGSFWIILLVIAILLSRSAGKKISDAAKGSAPQIPPVPPFPQVFPAGEDEAYAGEAENGFPSPEEMPLMEEEQILPEEAPKAVVAQESLKKEEKAVPASQKKHDNKIDPKKMVVYSEIFRAKYQE